MQHLDPESLSLLALGEELGDDAADHLRSCASCAADYAGLRRAVLAAKPGPPDASALESPGPQVWAGIHRSLGLSAAVAADPLGSPASWGPARRHRRRRRHSPGQSASPVTDTAAGTITDTRRLPDAAPVPGGTGRAEAGTRRGIRVDPPSRGVAGGRRGHRTAGGGGLLVRAAEPACGGPAGTGRTCARGPAFRHRLGPGCRDEGRAAHPGGPGRQERGPRLPGGLADRAGSVPAGEPGRDDLRVRNVLPCRRAWIWANTRSWTCPTSRSTAIPRTPA